MLNPSNKRPLQASQTRAFASPTNGFCTADATMFSPKWLFLRVSKEYTTLANYEFAYVRNLQCMTKPSLILQSRPIHRTTRDQKQSLLLPPFQNLPGMLEMLSEQFSSLSQLPRGLCNRVVWNSVPPGMLLQPPHIAHQSRTHASSQTKGFAAPTYQSDIQILNISKYNCEQYHILSI